MIHITFQGGIIHSNDLPIVNLKRPFKNILNYPITNPKSPSETFEVKGRLRSLPSPLYIPIKRSVLGSLYKGKVNGYPSYWVYETNTTTPPIFSDKSLHKILHQDLFNEEEPYEKIRQHLKVVISLLLEVYDFDCLLTDIKNLDCFTFPVPIVFDAAFLTSIPPHIPARQSHVLSAMWKGTEELPLRLFDWQLLDHLSLLRNSSFIIKDIVHYEKILILTGTNVYYAGFLAKELRKIRRLGGSFEPLPVTLFMIR